MNPTFSNLINKLTRPSTIGQKGGCQISGWWNLRHNEDGVLGIRTKAALRTRPAARCDNRYLVVHTHPHSVKQTPTHPLPCVGWECALQIAFWGRDKERPGLGQALSLTLICLINSWGFGTPRDAAHFDMLKTFNWAEGVWFKPLLYVCVSRLPRECL